MASLRNNKNIEKCNSGCEKPQEWSSCSLCIYLGYTSDTPFYNEENNWSDQIGTHTHCIVKTCKHRLKRGGYICSGCHHFDCMNPHSNDSYFCTSHFFPRENSDDESYVDSDGVTKRGTIINAARHNRRVDP